MSEDTKQIGIIAVAVMSIFSTIALCCWSHELKVLEITEKAIEAGYTQTFVEGHGIVWTKVKEAGQ